MEASFFLKLLLDFCYSTKGEEVYTGTPSSHRPPRLGRTTFDLPDFEVNEWNNLLTLSHWLKCHFLPLQRIAADLICRWAIMPFFCQPHNVFNKKCPSSCRCQSLECFHHHSSVGRRVRACLATTKEWNASHPILHTFWICKLAEQMKNSWNSFTNGGLAQLVGVCVHALQQQRNGMPHTQYYILFGFVN